MNEPRAPLNNKNWNDIDIYLFSNGEQYSPPRKYHLKSAELEFWESTIHYLARTQYGSMHSTIELYTLDGKKVNSPLELVDATSYVAVKPPDAFIAAGYERYLIKASRSWEKRQEKLTNSVDSTGEMQVIKELSKSPDEEFKTNGTPNIQNKNMTGKDDSIGTNNTILARLRKENDRSFDEKQKEYKPFLNRKSVDSTKNKITKKNTSPMSRDNSKDDSILGKKKNISVTKNVKCSSNRRQSIQIKSDNNNNKINIFNDPKGKIQPNITNNPEDKEIKEIIGVAKPNSIIENISHDVTDLGSDKELIISSDVYKNPESEVQSLYIDVDRKTIPREYISKEKYKPHELHKIEELNEKLMGSPKAHKAISVQSITCSTNKYGPETSTSFTNTDKPFNIKLNIKVRDDRGSTATDRSGRLGKCKSYTALLEVEEGSQANINIDLKDEDFKHEGSTSRIKSNFGDKAYLCSDAKVIVVNCTCGLLEAYNINNKSKENYIILIPSTLTDKNIESCWSTPDVNEPADKDCVKSHHSILNTESSNFKNNPVSRENSPTSIKHKVSICPDSPIKISAEYSNLKKHVSNVTSNKKVDQCTQTDWCNILLQARPQDNETSSFHLPPLRLLAQYNLL